ncbi:Multidrug resistance protein MdtA [compost metagenome]
MSVQQVKAADFAAIVSLTGDIQARIQSDLSFRVGGKIISRSVDVGDRVTAKQVLARLDPKDLQANVDSAAAAVFAEQARVKQASADFERQLKLLPKGYTSQSEFDSAQANLRSNESALRAAQAQLANARDQLGYTALVADAPGVITARQAEVGQVVQATMPIYSMARDGERDAVFNVYESVLIGARRDQPVTVSLIENPDIKAPGKIREVTPVVSADTSTVQVKVALSDVPEGMELGAVVSASGEIQKGEISIDLPWSALTKGLDEPAVWVVDSDNKVSLRSVQVLRYLTGRVILKDGLKDGEKVVVAGGQLLHPGMQIEIANESKDGFAP